MAGKVNATVAAKTSGPQADPARAFAKAQPQHKAPGPGGARPTRPGPSPTEAARQPAANRTPAATGDARKGQRAGESPAAPAQPGAGKPRWVERSTAAPPVVAPRIDGIKDKVTTRVVNAVRDGFAEGTRSTVDALAGVPHGLYKAGSGTVALAGHLTVGTAVSAADAMAKAVGLRNDKGGVGLDLGGARNGWEWWGKAHDGLMGEAGLEGFLKDVGARGGIRNGGLVSDGRRCLPNTPSRGYASGETAGTVAGLFVSPRPDPSRLPSGPIGLARKGLAGHNEATQAARAATAANAAPGRVTQALAQLEDAVNARTVGLKAGRELSAGIRAARFDPARAAAYAQAGRLPAIDDLARIDARAGGGIVNAVKSRLGDVFAAGQSKLASAWRTSPLAASDLVLDTAGLVAETDRARKLATASPAIAPWHQGWDLMGATFNHGLQRAEPVLAPARALLRTASTGTVALTAGGLGYGYASGALQTGQFRQGEPGNARERAVADYVNMPKDVQQTYIGFWPSGQARESSFVLACGSKTGVGDYPMALLPGQQGATPRIAVAPTGSSFTANSMLVGPIAMCSFNAALDTNRRLAFTVAGIGGRGEKPNLQVRTLAERQGNPSEALMRAGVQFGLGALTTTTDVAWDRMKLSAGNIFSLGAIGASLGTDGVKLNLSPVLAEPYMSLTTNSSWRDLARDPSGDRRAGR